MCLNLRNSHYNSIKEVAEAVALMELEETISNMCDDGI